MENFPGCFYVRDIAINQQVIDLVAEARLQRQLHPPWARVSGDYWEGNMVGLQASGQILRADQPEVFIHLEDFCFRMQVVYGRHFDTASGNAEGSILDDL